MTPASRPPAGSADCRIDLIKPEVRGVINGPTTCEVAGVTPPSARPSTTGAAAVSNRLAGSINPRPAAAAAMQASPNPAPPKRGSSLGTRKFAKNAAV